MTEFSFIEKVRQRVSTDFPEVSVGIGDDAAVLNVAPGFQLLASTDWLIEGVHFPAGEPPRSTGYKALAVNLSDMAAMGAMPRWALLSISGPDGDLDWIEETASGLLELAETENVALVGGDTSIGARAISVTILGVVEQGRALLRSGARAGDLVVISGVTGEAAFALEAINAGSEPLPLALDRLRHPRPRIALGRALVGKASACIDISDGLLADLGHVVNASSCGAVVELDKLPSSPMLDELPNEHRWELQLGGGDDYELCFTLPPAYLPALHGWSQTLGLGLAVIGSICEESGIRCLDSKGDQWKPGRPGWEHFK